MDPVDKVGAELIIVATPAELAHCAGVRRTLQKSALRAYVGLSSADALPIVEPGEASWPICGRSLHADR